MANDRKWDRDTLDEWARKLADDFLPQGWEPVPSSAYARVAHHEGEKLYYKEFQPRSPLESAKSLIRGSRATRARKNADALLWVGIDAPTNIHWGKLAGGREYLFMAEAPGKPVDIWLRANCTDNEDTRQRRRQLLRELGVFIGRMHATGFIHGDLRPGNVLADLQDGRFRFTLLDNERVRKMQPPTGRMLLRNLMQLNMLRLTDLDRTDRMRFFCEWRRQMRNIAPLEAKILAAEAYLWAMRRQTEN